MNPHRAFSTRLCILRDTNIEHIRDAFGCVFRCAGECVDEWLGGRGWAGGQRWVAELWTHCKPMRETLYVQMFLYRWAASYSASTPTNTATGFYNMLAGSPTSNDPWRLTECPGAATATRMASPTNGNCVLCAKGKTRVHRRQCPHLWKGPPVGKTYSHCRS